MDSKGSQRSLFCCPQFGLCVGPHAADITQLIYERGSLVLDTHDRFRLSLRDRDKEFFRKYVQREQGISDLLKLSANLSDSQRNIQQNTIQFLKKLEVLPEQQRLNLAKFIVTKCYLVVVSTPDLDSAYRIFSVLNTRGLDLSATDIVKAEIIAGVSYVWVEYTKKWEDTEEDIGRSAFIELFSHIRMVYSKGKAPGYNSCGVQGTRKQEYSGRETN